MTKQISLIKRRISMHLNEEEIEEIEACEFEMGALIHSYKKGVGVNVMCHLLIVDGMLKGATKEKFLENIGKAWEFYVSHICPDCQKENED